MLVPEKIRPNASQCLQHPWFSMESHIISNKISVTTLDRMKSYTKSLLFRQCVQYIIAYRCEISEEDAERFRKMFFKIDRDNNGFVTFENIKEFFSSYFKDLQQVRNFFDAMDIDGNGKVHWNEFLSCIIS